jgi:hypothetical protein
VRKGFGVNTGTKGACGLPEPSLEIIKEKMGSRQIYLIPFVLEPTVDVKVGKVPTVPGRAMLPTLPSPADCRNPIPSTIPSPLAGDGGEVGRGGWG